MNPQIFLQIFHHLLIDFSQDVYQMLIEKGFELYTKNDLRFMESVYRFLIKEFNYKPNININQFFTNNFLEQKLIFSNEVIQKFLKIEKDLSQKFKKPKICSIKDMFKEENKTEEMNSVLESQDQDQQKHKSTQNDAVIHGIRKIDQDIIQIVDDLSNLNLNKNKNNEIIQNFDQNFQQFQMKNHFDYEVEPQMQLPIQQSLEQPSHPLQKYQEDQDIQQDYDQQYQQINNQQIQQQQQYYQNDHFKNEKQNNQMKEVIKMMFELNENVQTIMKNFASFQQDVTFQISNLNAQVFLLENNQKMLKAQINYQQNSQN